MTAIDETANKTFYVALKFNDSSGQKDYFLTGNGKDQNVTAVVSNNLPFFFINKH